MVTGGYRWLKVVMSGLVSQSTVYILQFAQDMSNVCPRYAQPLPKVWGFKLKKRDKMSQQLPRPRGENGTFCRLGQFVARKMPVGEYGYAGDMAKFAQYMSKICPRYAQTLSKVWGFKLTKWDKMSPGRVLKLGHYVAGGVHNAVGHFVVGTFCLLTLQPQNLTIFIKILINNQ